MRKSHPWTSAENSLLDRFARDLVAGRFRNAGEAARTGTDALRRLNESLPKSRRAAARTYQAVHTRLLDFAHAVGGRWPGARWSRAQDSRIRPYARGLVQGRYRSANEAARHCLSAQARRRSRSMLSPLQPARFDHRTVEEKIREQAAAQGWRPDMREWSGPELRVLDGYGRGVKQGRYPTARAAARAYVQDLGRLQRRYPVRLDRTVNGVFIRLVQRLKRLKAWSGPRWPEPELRLLDRFARRLVDGRYATALPAAVAFLSARNALQERHPNVVWLRRRRTLKSVRRVICQRAHELGWSKRIGRWSAPERAILDRYARAVVRGRYRSILHAAPPCTRVLARLHRQQPDARWCRLTRTRPAVAGQLQIRVQELGIPRNNGRWTPGELEIVERFARRCGTPGYRTLVDATGACVRELERRHRREMERSPLLGPVQPRSFAATGQVLRRQAIDLGTWGPYAHGG